MKKTCLLSAIALFVLSTGYAFAAQEQDKIHCPSIGDLQQLQQKGFENVSILPTEAPLESGEIGSYWAQTGLFETSQGLWVFMIANIDATNSQDAYSQAIEALATLSGEPKPRLWSGQDYTIRCDYAVQGKGKNGKPLYAIAATVIFLSDK